MSELASLLHARFGDHCSEGESLAKHTNFRIGGSAQYFVEVRSIEELRDVVRVCLQHHAPFFVLGGGSNTLVADSGYAGVVIKMGMRDIAIEGSCVHAQAGAITAAVALRAGQAGLSGYEWAIGLPGTLGGAIRGNAGCFGGETKDVVSRVSVLDASHDNLPVVSFSNEACGFAYRRSAFKAHPEWIIIDADLELTPSDPGVAQAVMNDILERRRSTQPHDRPSAGCLFKNVQLHMLSEEQLDRLERFSHGAWRAVVHHGQIPVGWLVEQLEMKGFRIGGAQISERHGNFVCNLGGGTATDVARVADAVKEKARVVLGIEIEDEVQRLGF